MKDLEGILRQERQEVSPVEVQSKQLKVSDLTELARISTAHMCTISFASGHAPGVDVVNIETVFSRSRKLYCNSGKHDTILAVVWAVFMLSAPISD